MKAVGRQLITGHIKVDGCRRAGKRFEQCASILAKYGITFPPLYPGTINIQLSEPFATPDWENVIYIPQHELDSILPSYGEWWKFIPVKQINQMDVGVTSSEIDSMSIRMMGQSS